MAKIPVTVLTGFLGAGKTTLLNRVLSENHGRRFAVIVNEFGEIGIDNDLVVDADEEIFTMNNGCVCCTVRGDLIRILSGLLKRRDFDGILLETTGLADPSPIIQTFFMDDDVREATALDSVVTVVDALHFPAQVERSREAVEQVVYADLVVLNKADLVDEKTLADMETRIRRLNPQVEVLRTTRCDLPLDKLLGRDSFDLNRLLFLAPGFMAGEDSHTHDDAVRSVSLTLPGPVDAACFQNFLGSYLAERGENVYRCKGIVEAAGQAQRLVFQGVHMLLEMSWGVPWKDGEERTSRAVFIGRDLDREELSAGLRACLAAGAKA
ncbi:cobalamin synthesis protein P47K [Alkalidesulfovibrio alkalitolerans DSM 16529]|jgi:G3E family GTPase|uniref:Cobalamin synthesis protein P47K n=1 Tax=Alkalidesulfovibrio alkalitolerans DSM 16529 TaxID=1121439 RepID=S7TE36_9BACT|nr:GTP-binding protein [Alkalidesulfovibrio alkalitolerans]EPR34956.1 cobalamin synthesis protein P47K [Alkalidesulfovibrio alkalitolerans DSM 16529]